MTLLKNKLLHLVEITGSKMLWRIRDILNFTYLPKI